MAEKNPVQSAERIFQILETLAKNGTMALTELSNKLELHKSTVHRLLASLISMGYVKKEELTGKYMLTFKILGVAGELLNQMDIVSIAHPYLERLVEQSNETVHLVQREDNNIVYIDKVECNINSIRMVSRIGLRHPMICTAVGKAMMAQMSYQEVEEIWNSSKVEKLTKNTIITLNEFIKELKQVKRQGYALDDEENEMGVRCIGACVLDYNGKADNAFSISAPVSRMTDKRVQELAAYVLEIKKELSRELGYRGK